MTSELRCQLCGHVGADVENAIAWYREGRGVQHIARCTDHVACRSRVEANSEPWPLLETAGVL